MYETGLDHNIDWCWDSTLNNCTVWEVWAQTVKWMNNLFSFIQVTNHSFIRRISVLQYWDQEGSYCTASFYLSVCHCDSNSLSCPFPSMAFISLPPPTNLLLMNTRGTWVKEGEGRLWINKYQVKRDDALHVKDYHLSHAMEQVTFEAMQVQDIVIKEDKIVELSRRFSWK